MITGPISLRAVVQGINTDSSGSMLGLQYSQLSQLTCLLLTSSPLWALNQIVPYGKTVVLFPLFCLLSEEKRGPTYRELSVLCRPLYADILDFFQTIERDKII
jgi:hypothetical protein